MIDLYTGQFWVSNTPPPPINETINKYEVESELKSPTKYSYIYLGNNKRNERKVLKFVKCMANTIDKIENEILTMSMIDHPNIIKLEDYFRYNEYVCIVTPFIPLQSLHSFILENYKFGIPEKMACKIIHQLLNAVNYLHKNNIWHRDIKPDNILVVDSDQKNPKIKLADFGFARKFKNQNDLCDDEFLGTPEFTAPEIFKNIEYTNKVDIWSVGVSLFVMLVAKYPTCSYSNNPKKCRWLIERGLLNFQLLYELDISEDAIDLVKKLCTLDPDSRITAEDALNHPWLTKNLKQNEIRNVFGVCQNVGN